MTQCAYNLPPLHSSADPAILQPTRKQGGFKCSQWCSLSCCCRSHAGACSPSACPSFSARTSVLCTVRLSPVPLTARSIRPTPAIRSPCPPCPLLARATLIGARLSTTPASLPRFSNPQTSPANPTLNPNGGYHVSRPSLLHRQPRLQHARHASNAPFLPRRADSHHKRGQHARVRAGRNHDRRERVVPPRPPCAGGCRGTSCGRGRAAWRDSPAPHARRRGGRGQPSYLVILRSVGCGPGVPAHGPGLPYASRGGTRTRCARTTYAVSDCAHPLCPYGNMPRYKSFTYRLARPML